MKGFDSMLTRTLVAARTRLVRIATELSNQIRGIMKSFVPAGKGSTFERNVRSLLADQDGLASIVLPMLEAWRGICIRAAELGRQLVRDARDRARLAASLCPSRHRCDHRNRLCHGH